MNEDMNNGELLKEVAETSMVRKILLILKDCKDLEEAIKKIEKLPENNR